MLTRQQYWDQGGFEETFSYDALNRLETSTVQGRTVQTFRYDAVGNLLNKTGVGTGNYTYPAQGATAVRPHAVQSIPGIGNFVYDDNGNLTSGNGRTMSWTSFDMPLTISGGASATFVYGPEHQRIRQSRGDGSSVVYAGAQEVEKNASGTTVKTYWPGGIGVEIDRPGATVSELYWHHVDRLGSVIGLTDQQGVLKEKLGYDAWGKRRTIDGSATPNNLDGQVDNRGFTGHEMLDQLDLVHMNGRVYDPLVARFISGDPLVEDPNNGQSFNRYSYVLNNPTNLTDPSGFSSEGPACGQNNDCAEIPKVEVKAPREVVATEVSYGSSGGMQQVFVKGLRGNVPKSQAVDPKRNIGSANNTTRTFTDSWATGNSSQTGEQVVIHTGRWIETDNRRYATPGEVMWQIITFDPVTNIGRDVGASDRQLFWLGMAGMIGNPKQFVAQGAKNTLEGIGYTRKQLQHSFKHAKDFGVNGNANNKTMAEFSSALQSHADALSTKAIEGTYRGNPVTHFVDPNTGLNVIRDSSGDFLSGWKLSPQQLEHVMTTGKLGGGR